MMKILLVEDSATLRHAMSQHIAAAGHSVVLAKSGEEALQMLETVDVDMIIMDVEMPGLNGFETTRLIREWLGNRWIPIIFVTGLSDDENYREGIEAGGDDYLIKPVSAIIIQAKIRAMERITTMRDQLNRLNQELEALSQLDSLTQTFNRRTFTEKAQQQWLISTRQQRPLGALMIDVDHFKLYNDHYGHPAGDDCLARITNAIRSCLHRPADLLGRYGGEEFIVLLPDTDSAGVATVAQSIVDAVAALGIKHEVSPAAPVTTVSVGGCSCERTNGFSREHLIKSADKALYKAKRNGRNQSLIETIASHRTVLVAESSPTSLHYISQVLRSHYNILTADSLLESVEITRTIHPDLVIMNSQIAEKNDGMFFRHMGRSDKTSTIPLMILAEQPITWCDPQTANIDFRGVLAKRDIHEKLLEQVQLILD